MLAHSSQSVLVVVDLQPSFLSGIEGASAALHRSRFLVECAMLLDVPIIASEQVPERMGGTDPELAGLLRNAGASLVAKSEFACAGCPGFDEALARTGRSQVVLCGIETHICVTQTAILLAGEGHPVFLAADASAARTSLAHEIGVDRIRQAGCQVAHSESIVYEWMRSAQHPAFRDVLKRVKSYALA